MKLLFGCFTRKYEMGGEILDKIEEVKKDAQYMSKHTKMITHVFDYEFDKHSGRANSLNQRFTWGTDEDLEHFKENGFDKYEKVIASYKNGELMMAHGGMMAKGGEIMKHKHNQNITIELIEPTKKGWKVKQIETHSIKGKKLSTPKEKIAYFSKEEIKDLFENKMADGGKMAKGGEMGNEEGKIGGLTADESIYLYIKKAISQPSREKYLRGANLWKNAKAKEVELSLIKKGYLNNIGSINEIGKKKIKEIDTEIGYMLSSDYIGSIDLSKEYKRIVEKFNVNGYAKGGEINEEEGVDLFEDDGKHIPENVLEILYKYDDAFADGDYEGLTKANDELSTIGYTFEFYLDGQAYDLRKIGQKGKISGYAKGGKLDGGSNLEMLRSNVKEIEHHVSEMKNLLKKDMKIEAWVVAKAERSTTDLSDITHYLDGLQ